MQSVEQFRALMFRKRNAYRRCFLDDNGDLTPDAQIIFRDLAEFASLAAPTIVSPVTRQTDVPATMQRVGRGEVIQRCWHFLRLSYNQLYEATTPGPNE